jgi:isoleucyl-tRNA synthetase
MSNFILPHVCLTTTITFKQKLTRMPATARKRLTSHVLGRSEWCISRQRVWGVPIPSLHHVSSGRVVLNSSSMEHILGILEKTGTQWWWDGPVEDFVPPPLKAEGKWRKGTDTMDVWFDSGTSWSMLRSGSEGMEVGRKYDADVCLEGSDQHRGWFQSLLLTAVGSSPEIGTGRQKDIRSPYRALITHGMVLDEKGRKMSKSDGNIISPMTIINGGPVRLSPLAPTATFAHRHRLFSGPEEAAPLRSRCPPAVGRDRRVWH